MWCVRSVSTDKDASVFRGQGWSPISGMPHGFPTQLPRNPKNNHSNRPFFLILTQPALRTCHEAQNIRNIALPRGIGIQIEVAQRLEAADLLGQAWYPGGSGESTHLLFHCFLCNRFNSPPVSHQNLQRWPFSTSSLMSLGGKHKPVNINIRRRGEARTAKRMESWWRHRKRWFILYRSLWVPI